MNAYPESSFDAYEFELFYHSLPITEESRTLPPDYVPSYPWWDSAIEGIRARMVFNQRYLLGAPSLVSEMPKVTNVTFISERQIYRSKMPVSVKLALIEARRLVKVAHVQMREESYTEQEIAPYMTALEDAMKDFKREHKPTPFNPLRLFRGGLKR